MSSWKQVDFGLVRYSPIEGTHFFYDPAYPTAIQFLLNGLWESWDISYVKLYVAWRDTCTQLINPSKSQDPEIRRIAENAVTRVIRDSIVPGYRQWPSPPPPGGPVVGGHAPYVGATESPLPSPSSLFRENISPPSSQPRPLPSLHPPQSGPHTQPPRIPPIHVPSYASPYEAERPSTSNSRLSPSLGSAPTQRIILQPIITDLPGPPSGVHQPASTPHESHPPLTAVPSMVPSKSRETKVLLSLDGDGVRGLSQVLLVESLVNAVCTKIGAQVDPYQVFDLIGGCSMGGVLAIMLSRLRMQAHKAREAYKSIAKEVFSNKRNFFTSFDPHAPPKHQDGQAVEDAIKALVSQEVANPDELLLDSREDSSDV